MKLFVCIVLGFMGVRVFQFIITGCSKIDSKDRIIKADCINKIGEAKNNVRVASEPISKKSKSSDKKIMKQRHIVKRVFSETVNNENNTTSTFTLRFKEKTTSIGKMVFAEKSSNFTVPFSEEECDFENGASLEDKLWDRNNLLDDKVNERTANCSNYLESLFEILYRKRNRLFDK
jgi:PBP1b-binding outer membrane lipoprotein LpoB